MYIFLLWIYKVRCLWRQPIDSLIWDSMQNKIFTWLQLQSNLTYLPLPPPPSSCTCRSASTRSPRPPHPRSPSPSAPSLSYLSRFSFWCRALLKFTPSVTKSTFCMCEHFTSVKEQFTVISFTILHNIIGSSLPLTLSWIFRLSWSIHRSLSSLSASTPPRPLKMVNKLNFLYWYCGFTFF